MSTNPNTGTHRFEFIQGSSCKFWEVRCEGSDVFVCFGRIGTSGQQLRKPFPDVAKAQKHVEQLIRQKTSKGYVPVAA